MGDPATAGHGEQGHPTVHDTAHCCCWEWCTHIHTVCIHTYWNSSWDLSISIFLTAWKRYTLIFKNNVTNPLPQTQYCFMVCITETSINIYLNVCSQKKRKKSTNFNAPSMCSRIVYYKPVWVSTWLMLHNYIIHPVYIPSNLTIYTDRCYHRKFHGDFLTTRFAKSQCNGNDQWLVYLKPANDRLR